MLRQYPLCINWHFLLVGLFSITMQCNARAVNVSNTWTMPQEGLNVFYRFFRDRISWFEADAVCQFHHANLVTVDNSFQFDATRDLLRELDVNDIVWIGLMRPQSSDRFMWSNSRPLVADTGYWAESLPVMDAPLCAVIDPIRDYRWHALRCGGPETASFLCEMPVPSWADACNLKDMPNLTLQYMADTASIELIRNCQEEGLLRTVCKGKQDREKALQDLICPRERLEAQRINDITNSHFKSLQIINSIPSDNNENNDIELLPMEVNYGPHYPEETQTEKNTVQRLIEQFNVDELMQADEPSNMETVSSLYKIPGLIPKPVKKSAKKVLDNPKKDNSKQKAAGISVKQMQKDQKRLPLEMEDMMMGDQPLQGEAEIPEQLLNEEVLNELLEPLPHIKKTNIHKEDGLEKIEKEATAMKKSLQRSKEIESKKFNIVSTTATTETTTPSFEKSSTQIITSTSTTEIPLNSMSASSTLTTDELPRLSLNHTHKTHDETQTELDNTWSHMVTTTSSTGFGHPIHPQQPHSNVITEEIQHLHTKEPTDNSHFIPPMLMVKSHYVPPFGKHGHSEFDHHQHQQLQEQEQQHFRHNEQQLHLETTTAEPAGTTLRHEVMAVTTPKATAQTTLRTALSKQEDYPAVLITTTEQDSSSMRPITEKQTTEMEIAKNSQNLHYDETQTTMITTTLQSVASTSARTVEKDEGTSLPINSEEINKNNSVQETRREDIHELNLSQISRTDGTETTETTKLEATTERSLKSTQKPYNLETVTNSMEQIKETLHITTMEITSQAEQQKQEEEQGQSEKNKGHLQTTTETTEKQTPTQATEVLTTSTTVSQSVALKAPTTTRTKSLQQIEKDQTSEEKLVEGKEEHQDGKETLVKTTEVLQTSAAITKAKQENDNEERENVTSTRIILTPKTTTTIATITTTTTVKPITTTLPQNKVKSTETSFSSMSTTASVATTTATPTSTSEYNTSITDNATPPSLPPHTSTIAPSMPASTSTSTPTIITTTTTTAQKEIDTEMATATAKTEISTQTSSAPETTRNFLKFTTEIPFKPNRRRSLTKPETVSYMKKILG